MSSEEWAEFHARGERHRIVMRALLDELAQAVEDRAAAIRGFAGPCEVVAVPERPKPAARSARGAVRCEVVPLRTT